MAKEFGASQGLGVVAENWRHFEAEVLPKVAHELPDDLRDLSQLSFYFGSLLTLNLLGSASDRAIRSQDLPALVAALKVEVEAFLMSRTKG